MAPGTVSEKRKKVIDHITKVMNLLDPTGQNAKIYQEKFADMTDKQFDQYMRNFLNDEKANFYLEIVEYERDLTIENIQKCADYMKVPLVEKVALPYLSEDPDQVIVTPYPVPVGYIHEKRMQQFLMKKSAGSTNRDKRNPLSGQVTGDDKNAKNSDLETYSLAAMQATAALQEMFGPRADNMSAKDDFYNDILKDGYVSLHNLDLRDPYNKRALNTFATYYYLQGIATNLLTDLEHIPEPRGKDRKEVD